ncbi:hypothetical protein [Deinococcus humi]|uniref:Para-nitrobenzyl esterase n=1 Tax=Deinococcus humi TaxID=662880 RepID=A0A7W8NI60_9DEIO|nr:hypothetical protein [Deinococcus humi]MBB5365503.1 para-nitrobenzyl esterase [Deinococcus humi]GGO37568.1 hypothetical protein GCM10008949_42880 [Deinococcus humi]
MRRPVIHPSVAGGNLPGLGAHHSSSLASAFQSKVDNLTDAIDFTPAQRQLLDAFS